ncbi:MAG: hypothetical protein QNJ45_10805 [Ardenticatenaceae bacterium]|nr:hypothetical protein [Ardenticatenaceae bacterium]
MWLTISYIFHLISTVTWLGGLFVMALLSFTALRQKTLTDNQWLLFQRQLLPWIQASLIILLITGFYQMTVDPNYGGFLVIEGVWGWALLFKHVFYLLMIGTTLYWQFGLLPEIDRLQIVLTKRPQAADQLGIALAKREKQLLVINCALALLILIFTGIMTAV